VIRRSTLDGFIRVPHLVWVVIRRVASLGLTVRDLDHADFENLIHDVLSDGAEGPWISKGAGPRNSKYGKREPCFYQCDCEREMKRLLINFYHS